MTLDAVTKLFSFLDKDRPRGVLMTKVSKVIARKRPGLIPVVDRFVCHCYTFGGRRTWEAYSRDWLEAVQLDLTNQLPHWQDLAAIAPGPVISPLRALDIVAWRAGQRGFPKKAAVEADEGVS